MFWKKTPGEAKGRDRPERFISLRAVFFHVRFFMRLCVSVFNVSVSNTAVDLESGKCRINYQNDKFNVHINPDKFLWLFVTVLCWLHKV